MTAGWLYHGQYSTPTQTAITHALLTQVAALHGSTHHCSLEHSQMLQDT
jgi:hypothetical protein